MALSEEQLQDTFQLFDLNGNGEVTAVDMEYLLRGIGFSEESQEEILSIIKAMDSEGTGLINFENFKKTYLRKRAEPRSTEEIWKAFMILDKENKGKLMADTMQEASPALYREEIVKAVKYLAAEDEEGVNYEVWKETMTNLAVSNKKKSKAT